MRWLPGLVALQVGCALRDGGGATADATPTGVETGTPTPFDPCAAHLSGTICTIVGHDSSGDGVPDGGSTGEGAPPRETAVYLPMGAAVSPDGQLYFVDHYNHRVRTLAPDGLVYTVVGTGLRGDGVEDDSVDPPLFTGGPGTAFALNLPTGLAIDPNDPTRLYIAAYANSRVVRYDVRSGEASFFAGNGLRGYEGDGGDALATRLNMPSGVAVDPSGAVYASDQNNEIIRKVDLDGTITTVAGTVPLSGLPQAGYSGDGGPALLAKLHSDYQSWANPSGRVAYRGGALYIADTDNGVIREVDLETGIIDRFAGAFSPNPCSDPNGCGSVPGYAGDGGDRLTATFAGPTDLAFGPDGTLYVADTENSCIRAIDPDGVVSTFAGVCGAIGFAGDGGPANEANLWFPYGVATDAAGNVYIADTFNEAIRVVYK